MAVSAICTTVSFTNLLSVAFSVSSNFTYAFGNHPTWNRFYHQHVIKRINGREVKENCCRATLLWECQVACSRSRFEPSLQFCNPLPPVIQNTKKHREQERKYTRKESKERLKNRKNEGGRKKEGNRRKESKNRKKDKWINVKKEASEGKWKDRQKDERANRWGQKEGVPSPRAPPSTTCLPAPWPGWCRPCWRTGGCPASPSTGKVPPLSNPREPCEPAGKTPAGEHC